MTAAERRDEWRRLAGVYRALAKEADRRADAECLTEIVEVLHRTEYRAGHQPGVLGRSWAITGYDGRLVLDDLTAGDARHYETLLNAGRMTEAELP